MDLPALPALPFNSGRGVREYLLAFDTTSAAFAFVSASCYAACFLTLCSSVCAAAASSCATALAISDRCSCMLRWRGGGWLFAEEAVGAVDIVGVCGTICGCGR